MGIFYVIVGDGIASGRLRTNGLCLMGLAARLVLASCSFSITRLATRATRLGSRRVRVPQEPMPS